MRLNPYIFDFFNAILGTIFVLGGKEESVRKWASSKPNLLNVAVTRAKERLIMVGIKSNWENQQYFKVAINTLPIVDAKHI